MLNKKRVITNLIGIAIIAAIIFVAYEFIICAKSPKYKFQKGMCYVSWTADRYSAPASDESLKALSEIGTKWLAIVTTWYQEASSSTSINPTEKTPNDASIIHAINTAHSLGMKVMIKPHLDLINTSDVSWRGEIGCSTDAEWQKWFESYRDFILHYARIAQENKVDMLCIGTELTSVATIKGNMWKEVVITPIRQAYKGPITYAANWSEEFTHVTFWDMMDYVGIDAYFPLSDKDRPTFEEIKTGWEPWVKEIEEFQKKINKPIVFLEVGYCSSEGTAKTPWEEIAGGKLDLELQAECYRALLETFWDKEWFYGVYWWKWGTDVRFGGTNNRGFTPQNKPAQQVVTQWYSKSTPKRKAVSR